MTRLRPTQRQLPLVSIIPLVDILLILLVFFLVTSTFLNLDMLPLSNPQSSTETPLDGPATSASSDRPVLIRVLPDGDLIVQRTRIAPSDIVPFLASLDSASLLVLPSPQAEAQALVHLLDAANASGGLSVRVFQLEGAH